MSRQFSIIIYKGFSLSTIGQIAPHSHYLPEKSTFFTKSILIHKNQFHEKKK